MSRFYFTFGYDDGGGWAEVSADDMEKAIEAFCLYHPRVGGFAPYCTCYPAEEFEKTKMYRDGNAGKRDVEHIVLSHFDFTEVRRGVQ